MGSAMVAKPSWGKVSSLCYQQQLPQARRVSRPFTYPEESRWNER